MGECKHKWVDARDRCPTESEAIGEISVFPRKYRNTAYYNSNGDNPYWYYVSDEGFEVEVTVNYWMNLPDDPPAEYWCDTCKGIYNGIHECGEWMRDKECTCAPYHSNESGTIEESVCEYCKDKSDEIPF